MEKPEALSNKDGEEGAHQPGGLGQAYDSDILN